VACPIRAILLQEDELLQRTFYKGILRGLEQANLPRVCLEDPRGEEDTEATLARLEENPPPLLFILGHPTAERIGKRFEAVPRVYVDTAWSVNGAPVPPDPEPEGPATVVRAVLSAVHMASVLRDLGFQRPAAELSWPLEGEKLREAAGLLASAAGFRLVEEGESPEVLLDMRLHLGEHPAPLATLVERAETAKIPLISDDLADWGRGAAVVVLPDADLLGRVAAEQGRRLLLDRDRRLPRRIVGAYEIRVDLGAAEREGLEPPLGFLARADRLRRPLGRREPWR
jgi:hypothetical protein